MVVRTGDTRPPRREACDREPRRGWTARTEAGKLHLGGLCGGRRGAQPAKNIQPRWVCGGARGWGLRSPGQPITDDRRSGFPGSPCVHEIRWFHQPGDTRGGRGDGERGRSHSEDRCRGLPLQTLSPLRQGPREGARQAACPPVTESGLRDSNLSKPEIRGHPGTAPAPGGHRGPLSAELNHPALLAPGPAKGAREGGQRQPWASF